MNCKDCGVEVANIGELNKHRAKDCPGPKEVAPAEPIIPKTMMPDVISALPHDSQLRFEVLGYLDKEGNLHVQDVRWKRK